MVCLNPPLILLLLFYSAHCPESHRLYPEQGSLYDAEDAEMEQNVDPINSPTCGQATAAGGRVISGKDATAGEWPWQAKLETKDSGFTCGGSLITPDWIMTAAHCISNKDPETYRVTLGDLNRQKPEGTEQKFTVKRVMVHPDYNSPVPINNDIALLELKRAATRTSFVNTVCLPRDSDVVPAGTKCYISARHHIISRGHLPPQEPFFKADIEPAVLDLHGAEEKRVEESRRNQGLEQSENGGSTFYQEMPPPNGPLREISTPLLLNEASCGHSSSSSSRVVSGADATVGEWPWQARLQFNTNHLCGGTLIASEWVMTAAHCVLEEDTGKFKVVIGDVDRKKKEVLEQEFEVKRIIKHPLFSHPVPYENDIALFQLSRPAKRSDAVNTACLPGFLEEVAAGKECYITGWGQMFGEGESAPLLQQARMPVVSNGACAAKLDTSPNGGLHTDNRTWIVTSKMICAGDAGKTKTSGCFGDSGGPFQCKNTAGQWVVHGIVSWGDPDCSSSNHYTVFTRVSVFRKWIEHIIETIA